MNIERSLYLFAIAILLFIVGLLYGGEGKLFSDNNTDREVDLSGGEYLRMVYIGSSTCPFSNNEATHKMISFIKDELELILQDQDVNLITTGISTDMSTEIGKIFLDETGPYHELITGAGTFNLGIINYSPGATSTPQLLFFKEYHGTDLIGLNMNNFKDSQTILKTYNGQFEIQELYEALKHSEKGLAVLGL
ncbi:MAG: hypothetical protein WEA58_14675 [Balneolaceae bacterium]